MEDGVPGIPVKVEAKVDAELVRELDRVLDRTGLSGLSATTTDVLGSWIAPFHRENLMRWWRSFKARCAERSYVNERLIPSVLLALAARAAAEEEDAVMLDLHAQLLAGFRDADRADAPNKTFISILSEMRPIDFQVLRHLLSAEPLLAIKEQMLRANKDLSTWVYRKAALTPADVARALGITEPGVVLAAQNLTRLGCMRVMSVPGNFLGPSNFPFNPAGCQLRDKEAIYIPLELAVALLDALDEPRADTETILRDAAG